MYKFNTHLKFIIFFSFILTQSACAFNPYTPNPSDPASTKAAAEDSKESPKQVPINQRQCNDCKDLPLSCDMESLIALATEEIKRLLAQKLKLSSEPNLDTLSLELAKRLVENYGCHWREHINFI